MAIYKKGGSWYIDYYVHGRRMREKIGTSKKLARITLEKRRVEIAENRFLDIKKEKKIKFSVLAETFLNEYSKPNNRSYRKDKSFVKILTEFFGDRYLPEIDSLLIEGYKAERLKTIKPASVNRELDVLKSIFNRAIEWNMLSDNPAKNVKKFSVDDKRIRYLSIEEINRLIRVCSGSLYGIVILALNTGMRKSEILQLKWENVDFTSGVIYIPSSLSKNKCHGEIPMNGVVIKTLEELKKNATNNPYVFYNKKGSPMTDVIKSFTTALNKANIKDFRFHDLRHTFCSQLVNSGVDIYTVMALARHKSIKMTMRYAHLTPNQKRVAVEIIGSKMDTIWTPSPKMADEKRLDLAKLSSVN